jgi:hypothetical protein
VYSQGGEDGVIAEIFRRIGPGDRICVEYGAGDGLGCSNTANLWRNGWRALLVEADPDLTQRAGEACAGYEVTLYNAAVNPDGEGSIDDLLDTAGLEDVDFMSIDIDGDDYWHLCNLRRRPRVLFVEFNPTVPPHIDLLPRGPANNFGCSARSLKVASELRGFTMIGIVGANMVFVRTEDAEVFSDLEKDLSILMPPYDFMYLATDYSGHLVPVGAQPHWGLAWPPSTTIFVPNQEDLLEVDVRDREEQFIMSVDELRVISNRTISQLTAILDRRREENI